MVRKRLEKEHPDKSLPEYWRINRVRKLSKKKNPTEKAVDILKMDWSARLDSVQTVRLSPSPSSFLSFLFGISFSFPFIF